MDKDPAPFLERLRKELDKLREDAELMDLREISGRYGDPPYFDLVKLHDRLGGNTDGTQDEMEAAES